MTKSDEQELEKLRDYVYNLTNFTPEREEFIRDICKDMQSDLSSGYISPVDMIRVLDYLQFTQKKYALEMENLRKEIDSLNYQLSNLVDDI